MIQRSVAFAAFLLAFGLPYESGFAGGPPAEAVAAPPDVENGSALLERLDSLEKRAQQLEAENAQLHSEIEAMRATLRNRAGRADGDAQTIERVSDAKASSQSAAKSTALNANSNRQYGGLKKLSGLGGQYRINSYVVDADVGGISRAAARIRLRQNLDFTFDDHFSSHLQLELSHTTDNVTTTSESSRGADIDVRHAVLAYELDSGAVVKAGLLPFSDRAFDTQFSGDWDYNPLAVSLEIPVAAGNLRLIGANLKEGDESVEDDFLHFAADYRVERGDNWLDLGASLLNVEGLAGDKGDHVVLGLSGAVTLDDELTLSGFVSGSFTDSALLAAGASNGRGLALGLRLGHTDHWEVLATHATGRRDGGGFLPVMALAQTYGYWGLTGLLTVQGATDTGFDGDGVNLSNSGFGMTSVQGRYHIYLDKDLKLTIAGGYFGDSRTPQPRSSFLGVDTLGMLSWRISDVLSLDAGVAYAHIDDGVVGYANGVLGDAVFNAPLGVERDKIAAFTRLQAEFP